MATPLRFDQILPNGEPLRYDMPGACWDGTVEEVMAAIETQTMSHKYHLNESITDETLASYLAKKQEAQDLIPFLKDITEPDGKLFVIGVERTGMVPAFQQEITAHPEFMPSDIPPTLAAAKVDIFNKLRRLEDLLKDEIRRVKLAVRMSGDDLGSVFSAYYANAQLAAKRDLPDATMTVNNLKPFMVRNKGKNKGSTPTTPA